MLLPAIGTEETEGEEDEEREDDGQEEDDNSVVEDGDDLDQGGGRGRLGVLDHGGRDESHIRGGLYGGGARVGDEAGGGEPRGDVGAGTELVVAGEDGDTVLLVGRKVLRPEIRVRDAVIRDLEQFFSV